MQTAHSSRYTCVSHAVMVLTTAFAWELDLETGLFSLSKGKSIEHPLEFYSGTNALIAGILGFEICYD